MDKNWLEEWPTERGHYWFYGQPFRGLYGYELPRIHFVKVRHDGTGKPIYITNGHFMYKAEGAYGLWQPVNLPALPETFEFPTQGKGDEVDALSIL